MRAKKTLSQSENLCTLDLAALTSLKTTARSFMGPHSIESSGQGLEAAGLMTSEVRQLRLPTSMSSAYQLDVLAFLRIQRAPGERVKVQLLASLDRDEGSILNTTFSLMVVSEVTVAGVIAEGQRGPEGTCSLFDETEFSEHGRLLVIQGKGDQFARIDYHDALSKFIKAVYEDSEESTSFPFRVE